MSLRIDIEGHVAQLLIDRPGKRNAFTRAMWEAVPQRLAQISGMPEIRAVILRSAAHGGVFCAGADIAEMAAHAGDAHWCSGNQAAINAAQFALARFPIPTIAFVEGDCIGGGCAIAMACDIRVATPAARFGITPARLGLAYPLHDVKLLVDLIGPGQAKRMLFTGSLISANEALRIGLIEELGEDVSAILTPLLECSPHANRVLKSLTRRVQDGQTGDDETTLRWFADAFAGKDFAEGAAAFHEKRQPDFGPA